MTTPMHSSKTKPPFTLTKIYLPIAIGIVVIVWLFVREFDMATFEGISLTWQNMGYIVLAFLLIFMRDVGLIWRFKKMADDQLTWQQAFRVHILSEFTSAITPSAVGGSGLVIFFLNREKISVSKSTTIMIANLFLDELFFILICPVIFLFVPLEEIFNSTTRFAHTLNTLFWMVYGLLVVWTSFLFLILFVKPNWVGSICYRLFGLPFLKRWQKNVHHFTQGLIEASETLKQKSFRFWLIAFVATALSWMARFLVVNALFMLFISVSSHLVIFARQVLLWIVMIASPTPGGSGFSEYAFKAYYNDLQLGVGSILVITLIWRVISYYLYLLVGTLMIPKWLSQWQTTPKAPKPTQ